MTDLPHDPYISAVAAEFARHEIDVTRGDTAAQDDVLEGWIEFAPDHVNSETWQHGVYLGWDQNRGWHLIEAGDGRNIHDLDPGGVFTYSSPRQVACSAANALRGHLVTGSICNDGTWEWDSRSLESSITAWETSAA